MSRTQHLPKLARLAAALAATAVCAEPAHAALAAAPPACDWSSPGANPYGGSIAAAIAAYSDIPLRHRAGLWVRAMIQHPNAAVRITREGIDGPYSNLRDMHWGRGAGAHVCRGEVRRTAWAPGHTETALVYCSGSYGIAIPLTCNNVSRVDCHGLDEPPAQADNRLAKELEQPIFAPAPDHRPLPHQDPREVPEPGTLALVVLACMAGAAATPRSRKP